MESSENSDQEEARKKKAREKKRLQRSQKKFREKENLARREKRSESEVREKENKTSASDGVKRPSDDSSLMQNLLDRRQISLCLYSCRAVKSNLSHIRNRSDRDQLLSTTHSTAHKKKDGEVTMNRTWGSGCCYVFFSSDDCRIYFWCEIAFSHLFGTEKHIWKALKWQDSSAAFIVVVYLELDLAITIQARKRSTFCSDETKMVAEKIYRIMN